MEQLIDGGSIPPTPHPAGSEHPYTAVDLPCEHWVFSPSSILVSPTEVTL